MVIGPFGGLHDTDNSISIPDNKAQDTLNVRLTKDGLGLKSREGIAINATLTVTTQPVVGGHNFKTQGGNEIRLVMHNSYVAASANGAAFSNIVTTVPLTISYWDCADNQGVAYCASSNNTEVFSYNGSAVSWYPTAIPAGTQIEMTPDRMVVSGTAANPNRINYSQSGALTTFTAGVDAGSAFTDDIGITGDKITAIKYALGRLIFWTNSSVGACQGTGQFDTVCYDISKIVGTVEPASIVYANGAVYFRGNDNHFYGYDGQMLSKLTREQSVFVSGLLAATQRNNMLDSQADWNTGSTSPTDSWSSTITVGSIVPSTWQAIVTNTADFAAATLINFSTGVTDNQATFQFMKDNFSDGDLTAGPAWSLNVAGNIPRSTVAVVGGAMALSGGVLSPATQIAANAYVTATPAYGTWTFDITESSYAGRVHFIYDDDVGTGYSLLTGSSTITLERFSSESGATQGATSATSLAAATIVSDGAAHGYKVTRTEAGAFTVRRDGTSIITATDNTVTTSTKFLLRAYGSSGNLRVDNIVTPATASYKREHDTGMVPPTTVPVWGSLEISSTVTGASTMALNTGASNTSGSGHDSFPASDGTQLSNATRQYIQLVASATATTADEPVIISDYTIDAASTGTYSSPCIAGNTVASFGVLSCGVTVAGGGGTTFTSRSGASCPLGSAYGAQTNNGNLSAAANEAFQYRVLSTLTHATDTVRLDACSVSWVEAAPQATFGVYFNDDIYWSVVFSSGLRQNRVIHYDLLNGAFFPWDLRVSAFINSANTLYMGCSDCGKLYQFGGVDNDTGTAITSSWVSKDFSLGDPTVDKDISRMSVIMKNQTAGSLSLDYVTNGSSTSTKSLSMAGTAGAPQVIRNFNTGLGTKGNVFRIKAYNSTINNPWEIYGIKVDFSPLPWRTQ